MVYPRVQGRTFRPEPLTTDEIHRLLAAASTRSSSGIRIRALIGVLYGAGLRISEALVLKPKDVDTQSCTVRVLSGKGGKTRTVGIDPRSSALIESWLARRQQLGLNGHHPIFATYTKGQSFGQPLSLSYVRGAVQRLGAKAGIDKRIHPHGLRHSLAFDLINRGVPTHVIQAQLGHASLAVTDRYVRHLMPSDVVDVMRSREW
jgi:integrase/recombinase XerD